MDQDETDQQFVKMLIEEHMREQEKRYKRSIWIGMPASIVLGCSFGGIIGELWGNWMGMFWCAVALVTYTVQVFVRR